MVQQFNPSARQLARESHPVANVEEAGRSGWLLVGHGSRDTAAAPELAATARLVAARSGAAQVETCFLEFSEPTIAQAIDSLVAAGVASLAVVPLLLFSAGHAQHDIPAAVAAAAARHPRLALAQAAHMGCHPALIGLSQARYQEALAKVPHVPADKTLLIMVGRGSHEHSATTEMLRFAELRHALVPSTPVMAAYMAMAEPSLEVALRQAASGGARRIVVQPHLLFTGILLNRLGQTVDRFRKLHAQFDWVVARHLGPSEAVAEAIAERAMQALAATAVVG
ncbi:MAG TPA: sirohydrochlorin chelatase [Pirellulales bacterium]|nr:sirohydrochlorin chelatase [Pirellulales bacterium]